MLGHDLPVREVPYTPAEVDVAIGAARLGACVGSVPNLGCIGLNYLDHAAETNTPMPSQPIVFHKHTSALGGPNDAVVIATGSGPNFKPA